MTCRTEYDPMVVRSRYGLNTLHLYMKPSSFASETLTWEKNRSPVTVAQPPRQRHQLHLGHRCKQSFRKQNWKTL